MDRIHNSTNLSLWLLIAVNAPGIGLFLYFASWIWAPRGQEGLYYDAGDSISRTLLAFPFLAICTLFNIIISRSVFIGLFYYREFRQFALWLTLIMIWFGAVKYDLGRHFDGSRMTNHESSNQ